MKTTFTRQMHKLKCIASLCIAIAMAAVSAPVSADTLVDNVNGFTLNEKGETVEFTGLIIDNEGRVKQLLLRRDKRPKKVTYTVDGKGRNLMPGLIDAHGHVMGIGFQALTLDLSGTRSLADAQAKIASYAAENPSLPWILGSGWNQEKWGLGRFPTAAEIDAVVPDRPVWLQRIDGHAGWANSRAMSTAGVTAASKSPPGGRIERSGGKPSGIFVDAAETLVQKAVPAPRPADRDRALAKAQQILLSQGVTAIADMGTTMQDWQSYRRAGDNRWLRIRIMSYAAGIEQMVAIGGTGPSPWLYDDKLRLNGVKLYLDGALGSRGAWLKQPYADKAGERGLAFTDDTKLLNQMSRAAMDNYQVAVHAIGDQANAQILGAINELSQSFQGDRRWRVEHAQIVEPADIAAFGRNGIIASMQPVHQTSDRLMAEARLGLERLAGAYAWKSIRDAGGKLAFGSDAPVESSNPFPGIAVAMTREDADGEPFGGWQPQERLTRLQALAGFTHDAAYAGFAEKRFGTLMPGMRADFVIVDNDILFASPRDIRKIQVLETWVGGEKLYEKTN
ncbi:amidohydrolase [Sphingorhabdus sp. Alg239-R122]|uniref:amidohydrolase n=1 Tax=Sphingorhabdus sp. Alg239-R122 TaxID=2305989 RepID=UPI001F07E6EB|nr:amidohydrolase [Sphingorhabdus sp. Alg239-R122]